jgi:hypothetical protein
MLQRIDSLKKRIYFPNGEKKNLKERLLIRLLDWRNPYLEYSQSVGEDDETSEVWNQLFNNIPDGYSLIDRELFSTFEEESQLGKSNQEDQSGKGTYDSLFSFTPIAFGYYGLDQRYWKETMSRLPSGYKIPDQPILDEIKKKGVFE